jgi:hypothetical protein
MRYIAGHLSAHVSSKLWLFGPFLDFEKAVVFIMLYRNSMLEKYLVLFKTPFLATIHKQMLLHCFD